MDKPTDKLVTRQIGRGTWQGPESEANRIFGPQQEATRHPDDIAVDRFARMMKDKLRYAREVKGRSGWDIPENCPAQHLRQLLREHMAKGDGVDVANLAMMLALRGEPTVTTDTQEDDAFVAGAWWMQGMILKSVLPQLRSMTSRGEVVGMVRSVSVPKGSAPAEPDYCYDPTDWDVTHVWGDRHELVGNILDRGSDDAPVEIATLMRGPSKFVVWEHLDTDGDGEADDRELRWFDRREDAVAYQNQTKESVHG